MPTITSPLLAWVLILLASVIEVLFAVTMKLSEGYTRLVPGAVSVAAAVLSVWLMSLTLKVLPLGTAYAVWAGLGTAGTALAGIVWFGESADFYRMACIGAVVAGIVGLQLQGVE